MDAAVRLRLVPSLLAGKGFEIRGGPRAGRHAAVQESEGVQAALLQAYRDDGGPAAGGRAPRRLRRGLHGVALPPREDGRAYDRLADGYRRVRRRVPPLDAHKPFFPDLWRSAGEL